MITKEIKKTVYETVDGQQFDIESEAKEHEAKIFSNCTTIEDVAAILKNIVEIGFVMAVHLDIKLTIIVHLKDITPNLGIFNQMPPFGADFIYFVMVL